MAKITIAPSGPLIGDISVPSDKSITHRSLIISALSKGRSVIKNPLLAEDCLSTARCLKELGVIIEKKAGAFYVQGVGLRGLRSPARELDCGNSGTTMRLISGVLAGHTFSSTLIGDRSLSKRPMDRVARPLTLMGADVKLTRDKFAPMTILGRPFLEPIQWKNNISSAQVKSCVLLAGLYGEGITTFEEPSLSRDHTERMLDASGANITRRGNKVSIRGNPVLKAQTWIVPGDFSSAAFFIVASLLVRGSKLKIKNVNLNPTRIGLLRVLQSMGAQIKIVERTSGGEPLGQLIIQDQKPLRCGKIEESLVPHLVDEVPILAVAATQAHGKSVLKGIGDLRAKETDRLHAMAVNLKAMGANLIEKEDEMIIEGPTVLKGAHVKSFDDHRIAMSMAVAGLIATGKTVIHGSECVNISFPSFWSLLKAVTR